MVGIVGQGLHGVNFRCLVRNGQERRQRRTVHVDKDERAEAPDQR